ncbi:MAG: dTDP-4-dehydrorhamnose reductase [Planctomycetota bacterium]|nr:dTDP-4-dehydrorhamnose reductase [Planctomycetota bacterium]
MSDGRKAGPVAGGRVLVTGAAGMLGSQLLLSVPGGFEAVGTDLCDAPEGAPRVGVAGVDLAERAAVEELFDRHGPFAGVVHTAAYTAVDRAESEEELALRVNEHVSRVLAAACAAAAIPMVLVGTDFVFDGRASRPYTPDDPTNPLGAYGRTKLAGENAARETWPGGVRVVRTQWLYGPRGGHFPGTILRLAEEQNEIRVVADQLGSPTSTIELAPALWDVLSRGTDDVYHAACEGAASWYELAVACVELAGLSERVRLKPCTTDEFPRPAPRPAYSVLDCSRLTALRGRPLAPWREALETFFAQIPERMTG